MPQILSKKLRQFPSFFNLEKCSTERSKHLFSLLISYSQYSLATAWLDEEDRGGGSWLDDELVPGWGWEDDEDVPGVGTDDDEEGWGTPPIEEEEGIWHCTFRISII